MSQRQPCKSGLRSERQQLREEPPARRPLLLSCVDQPATGEGPCELLAGPRWVVWGSPRWGELYQRRNNVERFYGDLRSHGSITHRLVAQEPEGAAEVLALTRADLEVAEVVTRLPRRREPVGRACQRCIWQAQASGAGPDPSPPEAA